jgi:3-phenylpropionate/cinnamic acid dioxygenase small subunit
LARAAIAALVYGYAELMDAGDFAAVGRLFASATFRAAAGGEVHVRRGAEEVRRQFEQLVRLTGDGTPGTKHVTTNLTIELDAGAATATARSYFTVLQARPGPDIAVVVAGRYQDAFGRDASGAWHFTDRLILTDLVGDVSRHLRGRPLG